MSSDKIEKLQQIKNKEKIFLIEVVIQKVFLDVLELNELSFRNTETCLSYKFLEYGPFKICERAFKSKVEEGGCAGCSILKNGNSTMFPLFPDQITDLKVKGFQIDVDILKMFKPIPKTIGSAEVSMKDIFRAVVEHMTKKSVETVSKSMKNRYRLKNAEDDPVGYVDLFLRLSSMGKMIVTKFQMDTAKECVEFHTDAGNTYKYQKQVFPDPYLCRPCGQPTKMFPPYEKVADLPKDFPAFKVTPEMKSRLQSRRNKELGIEEEPPKAEEGKKEAKPKKNAKKAAGKPAAPAPAKQRPQPQAAKEEKPKEEEKPAKEEEPKEEEKPTED